MWLLYEHRDVLKRIPRLPLEILKKYEKWKDIAAISGPEGLRCIRGFYDEALKGKWLGYRSSRLSIHYRVIYKIDKEQFHIFVVDVNPHDYRR